MKDHQLEYLRQTAVGKVRNEEQMFDIGPETIRIFSNIISEAKTIVWNGPLGYVEDERFASGSLAIANAILRSDAFSVVGGGDTNAFLAANNGPGQAVPLASTLFCTVTAFNSSVLSFTLI